MPFLILKRSFLKENLKNMIAKPKRNSPEYWRWYYSRKENIEKRRRAGLKWSRSDKGKEKNKNSFLLRHYGISLERYRELEQKQNRVCAICHKADVKSLDIDHNHKTGKVRGLLCRKCNTALGSFHGDDGPSVLNNAIAYIEKFKS
jgi:hypothetical protein